ncbi:RNA polymerase sigma factor [Pedobacter chitinilyticus]|uniref:RNA polymerase sigma-70 factor n=1 Tax=Pedobacter chitinilyticus TaxID=2233776 RepID=A0A3S3PTR9_9SPHI|nr:RNA polymerase sigma-70 factor [Pedobacter chitinilyticus]RWU07447.1 RNA polymerase sigma-70 factor [Pedobacter chitinilyticus]
MKGKQLLSDHLFPIYLGKEMGFELAYRSYHQPLRFFATRYVSEEDAQDLIENIFVRLWHKNQVFDSPSHLQAFLYRAAYNACLSHIKAVKNAENRHHLVGSNTPEAEESFMQTMIRAEVLAEIYRAINSLPLQCAKVITLSFVDGLSNKEIAQQLDLTEQTVKNHKVRGLKILRDQLSGDAMVLLLSLPAICKYVIK